MNIDIRLPEINGKTEAEQLQQIRRYLFQLAETLNWGLNVYESNSSLVRNEIAKDSAAGINDSALNKTPQATFNSIKSLIINSADVVNAYYEEISRRLEGVYVAESPTGEYKEETQAKIDVNSSKIDINLKNTQTLSSKVGSLEEVIQKNEGTTTILSTDAWIKIGALSTKQTGHYLYGMEIGQTDYTNGEEVKRRFARYTSEGVYLYDGTASDEDDWCVKIADKTIEVREIRISILRMGNTVFLLKADGSIVEKWSPI